MVKLAYEISFRSIDFYSIFILFNCKIIFKQFVAYKIENV